MSIDCGNTSIPKINIKCRETKSPFQNIEFNPETKEVMANGQIIGLGEFDKRTKVLQITKLKPVFPDWMKYSLNYRRGQNYFK